MYVDDSGSSQNTDHTDYFILAGIVVDDKKIKTLQRAVFEYKQSNFTGDFIDSEIHTYDIYKKRGKFSSVDHVTKIDLLNKLYEMIRDLDCTGIISVVNKKELQSIHPMWNILTTSWSFILETYDRYLKDNSVVHGKIAIDKSSNKIQRDVIKTIQELRMWGTKNQRISQITKSAFDDSTGVYGIQIADAFAYCALQHNKENKQFDKYWDIVYNKLKKNDPTMTSQYKYKKYP